jgi:hypothetical protein
LCFGRKWLAPSPGPQAISAMNGGGQEPMSLTAVRLPGWPKRTGLRCLAQVEGLAGEGGGCGIVDPGGLAAVVGNLPALTDQRAPLPWMRFSRGRCAVGADLGARNLPARSPPPSSFGGARCHADRLRRAGPDAPRAAGGKGGRAGVRAR